MELHMVTVNIRLRTVEPTHLRLPHNRVQLLIIEPLRDPNQEEMVSLAILRLVDSRWKTCCGFIIFMLH
jgi:hypothetical protein